VIRIGVVGEFDPDRPTQVATGAALEHAARSLDLDVSTTWIDTARIGSSRAPVLDSFDGLLIAPGSPYRSLEGALEAIRFARTEDRPLLGTCGGFQHLVLEYGRNVIGLSDAHHAEYDPDASVLFITPLSCSLAGKEMDVVLSPDTKAASAYGCLHTKERYYCSFGLNPAYEAPLADAGLEVSGRDGDGEPRIVEVPGLRFYVGTLFVPQTASAPELPHPLVRAFVRAAAQSR
jgi:CTP synthase (UTP-ammonia lyase)